MARSLGWPNLIMAHPQDSVTAVCLLQELHIKDSLWHLLMKPKADAAGKAIEKLSFCLFCMYLGSNDPSYINHIICGHYNVNYGCGKCLKEVFTTRQPLKNHMKVCEGLPKDAMDEASAGSTDHTPTTLDKKKHASKDPSPGSQLPPQSSQGSSQGSPNRSQNAKKKPASTPKKSDSGHREEECSFCHKHHGEDKSGEKSSVEKHSLKRSHKKSSKKSSKKSCKKSSKEKYHEKEKLNKKRQCNPNKTGKNKSSKKLTSTSRHW